MNIKELIHLNFSLCEDRMMPVTSKSTEDVILQRALEFSSILDKCDEDVQICRETVLFVNP